MKTHGIISVILFFCTIIFDLAGQAFDPQVKALVFDLERAIKTKDFSIIKDKLDEKFTYKGMQQPTAGQVMQQVVNGYPLEVKSITINNVYNHGDYYVVKITITTSKEEEKHDLFVSNDYQFIKADIVNIQIMNPHGGNHEASLDSGALPDRVTLPLRFENGLPLTKVKIEGKEYDMIIDTGAPAIIINTDCIEIRGEKGSVTAHGSTGSAGLKKAKLEKFQLGSIALSDAEVMTSSLGHLRVKSAGFIGASIFKNYVTVYNYPKENISMFKASTVEAKKRLEDFLPITTTVFQHLPIIEVRVGSLVLHLLVDTGAADFVIYNSRQPDLKGHIQMMNETAEVRGVGKEIKQLRQGVLDGLNVGSKKIDNVKVLFDEPLFQHADVKIDGIIGYTLLSTGVYAYDAVNGRMYIEK